MTISSIQKLAFLKKTYIFRLMDYTQDPTFIAAAQDTADNRAQFIRKTYTHVAGALAAFIILETIFIQTGIALRIQSIFSGIPFLFFGVVIAGGFITSHLSNSMSRQMQYLGLAVQVVFYAVIFALLIPYAIVYAPKALPAAALTTGGLTLGLTSVVFSTRKDFSFLAPIITIGFFILLAVGLGSFIFNYAVSTMLFAGAGALLAAGALLFDTSKVLHHYPTHMHVGASVHIFGSIMTLFWYILQLFMSRD